MTANRLHEPLDFFLLQLSTFHNWCCQDMLEHGKALSDTVNVSNDTITWKCTTLQAEFETKGKPLLSSSNLQSWYKNSNKTKFQKVSRQQDIRRRGTTPWQRTKGAMAPVTYEGASTCIVLKVDLSEVEKIGKHKVFGQIVMSRWLCQRVLWSVPDLQWSVCIKSRSRNQQK